MGRNNRKRTTVTRSISFDDDVFAALEARRAELRVDRSTFVKMVMEDTLGILPHPELKMGHKAKSHRAG